LHFFEVFSLNSPSRRRFFPNLIPARTDFPQFKSPAALPIYPSRGIFKMLSGIKSAVCTGSIWVCKGRIEGFFKSVKGIIKGRIDARWSHFAIPPAALSRFADAVLTPCTPPFCNYRRRAQQYRDATAYAANRDGEGVLIHAKRGPKGLLRAKM
jgi:hypothetical protein